MPKSVVFKLNSVLLYFLILIIIIDPSNKIFHLKDVIFILFFLTGFRYVKTRLPVVIVPFLLFIFFFTSISANFANNNIDKGFWLGYLKAFLFLLILLWIKRENIFEVFFAAFNRGILVISIITITIYLFQLYMPQIGYVLLAFDKNRNFINVSERVFLGYKIQSIYYKTSALIVIPLSFFSYSFFVSKNTKKLFLLAILYCALVFSGTRANILASSSCVVANYILYLAIHRRKKLRASVLGIIAALLSSGFLILLLSDTSEHSLTVKAGHLESLFAYFVDAPIYTFLLGSGAGSLFYSTGTSLMTSITELTYLEIIRMFGVIGGTLILLIFYYPSIKMGEKIGKSSEVYIPFLIGYLCYLLIGATNPLFFGSTGFIVLAYGYVIIENDLSAAVKELY